MLWAEHWILVFSFHPSISKFYSNSTFWLYFYLPDRLIFLVKEGYKVRKKCRNFSPPPLPPLLLRISSTLSISSVYLVLILSTASYTCPEPLPWHLLIAFPPISGLLKIEKSLQTGHFRRFVGPITFSCFSKLTSPFLL